MRQIQLYPLSKYTPWCGISQRDPGENPVTNRLSTIMLLLYTKNYNSLIIGRIPLSKESIYYNSYTAIVKKFKQHHVLSVHQIDQKNLPKFFDPTYNKYFIK